MNRLHHVVDGPADAPVVVLAGSLGSTLAMWDPQVPALAERFRVVRFDHRGHGKSPVVPGPFALADLGGDVVELLDRLDTERAHVVGLSLGGMVAMWLGAHVPERVDRLAVLCTSALLGPASGWTDRAAVVRAEGTAAVADAVVARWFTPEYAAANPELVAEMRAMVAGTPSEGYAACCEVIARMDLTADLSAITAPVLAIAGADDPATPPVHLGAIAAGVADGRFTVVGPGAHLASYQQAPAVNRLLLDHLLGEAT
ncbi:MAG TPA: 3-oxoadipate enol-lactonase [Mycobacteriales bacterium]